MAYQYATLRTPDTDKLTIAMWCYSNAATTFSFPLLQFGPQPPLVGVNVDLSGGLGFFEASAGGTNDGEFRTPRSEHILGNFSGIGDYEGGFGQVQFPFNPQPVYDGDPLHPHYGITDCLGFRFPGDTFGPLDDFHSGNVRGAIYTPVPGGGTPWHVGPGTLYESGLIHSPVGGEDIAVAQTLMEGGSKMPQQPSGLIVSGGAPLFIATSRIGRTFQATSQNLIGVAGPNQKILYPAGTINFGQWNFVFINWDGSVSGYLSNVNGRSSTLEDHQFDDQHHFFGSWFQNDLMAVKDGHVGLPLIPDQDGPNSQNYVGQGPFQSPFGDNPLVRMAYVQAWIGRCINPGDFSKFYRKAKDKKGNVIPFKVIPPKDVTAAQKAYGKSDLWFYRDKSKGIKWKNYGSAGAFKTVGTKPRDYFPGPGQTGKEKIYPPPKN